MAENRPQDRLYLLQFAAVDRTLPDIVCTGAMSAKLLEVAEKLPPDATISDAIYELELR
jgi:hypothetical protein